MSKTLTSSLFILWFTKLIFLLSGRWLLLSFIMQGATYTASANKFRETVNLLVRHVNIFEYHIVALPLVWKDAIITLRVTKWQWWCKLGMHTWTDTYYTHASPLTPLPYCLVTSYVSFQKEGTDNNKGELSHFQCTPCLLTNGHSIVPQKAENPLNLQEKHASLINNIVTCAMWYLDTDMIMINNWFNF